MSSFGGSFVAATLYWCGSKDCLARDEIARVVTAASLTGIEAVFDEVLVTIGGVKNNVRGQLEDVC